jgi:hypothetical protein
MKINISELNGYNKIWEVTATYKHIKLMYDFIRDNYMTNDKISINKDKLINLFDIFHHRHYELLDQ